MNYAVISGEIKIPVCYQEMESLDWFIDQGLKIEKSNYQIGVCSVEVARLFFEACVDTVLIDTYNDLYQENFRFNLYVEDGSISGFIYRYPRDYKEEDIIRKPKTNDLSLVIKNAPDIYFAIDWVVKIYDTAFIDEEFKNLQQPDIYSATFNGDFNYNLKNE